MKVYRVEHRETGKGPWTHDYAEACDLDANGMPTPSCDTWLNPRPRAIAGTSWRYALPDLERFVRWFSECDCRSLDVAGFVLVCYVVPRRAVRRAQQQALFDYDYARARTVYVLPDFRAMLAGNGS